MLLFLFKTSRSKKTKISQSKKEEIPINPMYFAKKGKRYRSLGCEPCTLSIESNATKIEQIVEELRHTKIAERSGRAQDKERIFTMQKLRALGYM